jgi:hypothetical protein
MVVWLPLVIGVLGVLAYLGIRRQEAIDRTKPPRR